MSKLRYKTLALRPEVMERLEGFGEYGDTHSKIVVKALDALERERRRKK